MSDNYEPPEVEKGAFHCPHCGVYAKQNWQDLRWGKNRGIYQFGNISRCQNCEECSVWVAGTLYFPKSGNATLPAEEMPEGVRRDYEEARQVVADSPRAAAALLRLAIQRLVNTHLDVDGGSLYEKIGDLVEKGRINPRTKKALDSVRVIGNNSVHPGEMDMDDGRETALALFDLLNVIIEQTIATDEMIDDVFGQLPDGSKQGIEKRDS